MQFTFNASLVLVVVLYTLLVSRYARVFVGTASRFARPLLIATLIVHGITIGLRGILEGSCPLGNPWDFCTLVAFSISLTYFIIELRIKDPNTGIFILVISFLLQLLASTAMLSQSEIPVTNIGAIPSVHVLGAIVGYSAALVSGVYALLYLFLYLLFKRGDFGLFYQRMPSLETLSSKNFQAAVVVFLALSISLAFQFIGGDNGEMLRDFNLLLSRSTLAITWIMFGAVIAARRLFRMGGKRLAYSTILGLALPLVVMVIGLIGRGASG